MIKKEDIGKFFVDQDGYYWQFDGWIDQPAAILHRVGDGQETSVVFTAPIAENYSLVDIDHDTLHKILLQSKDSK